MNRSMPTIEWFLVIAFAVFFGVFCGTGVFLLVANTNAPSTQEVYKVCRHHYGVANVSITAGRGESIVICKDGKVGYPK